LRSFVEGFGRRTGIEVTLEAPVELGRLPSEIEMTIFRIVQEGLVNVHRHSGSAVASVRLAKAPGGIALTMKDWGRGMPADVLAAGGVEPQLGVGILGMRERAVQLGGRLDIESTGGGTGLFVFLPWKQSDEHTTHSDRG
jgi:signal transduction histidine kinase